MMEFCPASLSYERVGSETALIRQQSSKDNVGKSNAETSSLYGFELRALGPRTITKATLAFDTSAGWYTIDVPAVTLIEKDRHYSAPWVSFTRHDYVTPVFYVHFPEAVAVANAWVYSASVQDDAPFQWSSQGAVLCDPPPAPSEAQRKHYHLSRNSGDAYKLADGDKEDLSVPPTSGSLILPATTSKPLESTDCAEPFREAEVKYQAEPRFPNTPQTWGRASTSAEVAIEASGTLGDAWIWGPSGVQQYDDETLRTARTSTYNGARSYCRAVPALYYFRVTFDPNG